MSDREPLALKALKLPYQLSMFLLNSYSAIFFMPFKITHSALGRFIYSQEFESGSAKYYMYMWPIRGILSLLLLALWLGAVFSPIAWIYSLDHYVFHTNWRQQDALVMSIVATLLLGSILAGLRLKSPNNKNELKHVLRLNKYFFQDVISTILTIFTIAMLFNASRVFAGHFDGDERRYFGFIWYLFMLSIVDWTIFLFKVLIIVYPVRKQNRDLLHEEHREDEFKQKMVTLQEGLYTLRDLCFLPMELPLYLCLVGQPQSSFMSLMTELSQMKIKNRIKLIFLSNLLFLAIILAIFLNGPFQNLTFRMFREMNQVTRIEQVKDNYYMLPLDGFLVKKFIPIEKRIKGAFIKFILLITLSAGRIRLISLELSQKLVGRVKVESNWFVYALKNMFLELSPNTSAYDIFIEYKGMMLEDFETNLLLILSLVFNPFSFIQILVALWKCDPTVNRQNLKDKNDLIREAYPMIIFDIPVAITFLITTLVCSYQIPKNLPLFKKLLGNSQAVVVVNGFKVEKKPLFFSNLFSVMIIQLMLLKVDLLTLSVLPSLILLSDHRSIIFQARSEIWFDINLRGRLISRDYFKYIWLLYYRLRIAILKDVRYLNYIKASEDMLAAVTVKPEDDPDRIDDYYAKVNKGAFRTQIVTYRSIFMIRFWTKYARAMRVTYGVARLGSNFERSDELWMQIQDSSIDKSNYQRYMDIEKEYANWVSGDSKKTLIMLMFKVVSLLLLWRLPTFTQIMRNGPMQNPDENYPKDIKLVLRLYKYCFRLLFQDLLYRWTHTLLLLFSSADRKYVEHKWRVLIQETPLPTEQFLKNQFNEYFQVKREYAGFVLDDILRYLILAISYVLIYRRDLFSRIQLLVTLPQLENMNARNVNKLMLMIVVQDMLATVIFMPALLLSMPRLYSFVLYVKEGYFYQDINVNIKYDKTTSQVMIQTQVREAREKVMHKIASAAKTDLITAGGLLLTIVNPTKLYFWNYLKKKLTAKYRSKKLKQGRDFFDANLSADLRNEVKYMLDESKEDFMSLVAISIILFGVYEVSETWTRVGKLIKYKWRQSDIYRWLNRPRKELQVVKQGNKVFLNKLNWMCFTQLSEYLTIQDKLVMCQLNKKSKHYFMTTPFIWIHYYRDRVNLAIVEIDDTVNVAVECINHFRRELAEHNNKELDFKLGIRFVLKEEAIRSVISLPQLVSSPYHFIFKVRDILAQKNIVMGNVIDLLARYHQDAENEFNQWNVIENNTITYRFRFRNQPHALSTDLVPEEFKSRMRGFEVLEYAFYKCVFFVIDKCMILFGLFVHDYEYSSTGPINFLVNLSVSLLQPVGCILVLAAVWYIFKFYYSLIGMDFIHSLVGPLGIHILIGIVVVQLQMHPYYANRRLNPIGFFVVLQRATLAAGRSVVRPLYQKLSVIVSFILFKLFSRISDIFRMIGKGVKGIATLIYYIYTLPVILPTQLLVGKGTIPEILHLGIVLVWISWPAYIGWKVGGIRNLTLSVVVCLAQVGVAIQVIRKYSQR